MKKLMGFILLFAACYVQASLICAFLYPGVHNLSPHQYVISTILNIIFYWGWCFGFYLAFSEKSVKQSCLGSFYYKIKIDDVENEQDDGVYKYYFMSYTLYDNVGSKSGNKLIRLPGKIMSIREHEELMCAENNCDNCIIHFYKQISKEEYGE